jgi:hypothetical protein
MIFARDKRSAADAAVLHEFWTCLTPPPKKGRLPGIAPVAEKFSEKGGRGHSAESGNDRSSPQAGR